MSEKAPTTYRLIRLEAENIKRLKAVAIEPTGRVIEITGANGAGKTSVLDSLWWALTGGSNIQSSPIRRGEESARIHLNLGAIIVTRKFHARDDGGYTTSIQVENEDGLVYKKPQSILDAIVDELTMDPLAFARARPQDQFDSLKALVPSVDFDAIEAARKADFEERTDVNRKLRDVQGQVAAISFPDDTPEAPIDVEALIARLQEAGKHNAAIETEKGVRSRVEERALQLAGQAETASQRAQSLRRQADEADKEAETFRLEASGLRDDLEARGPLQDPIDTSEITQQLHDAKSVNDNVRRRVERNNLIANGERLEAEAKELTKKIEEREEAKREAISAAKLPVEGLGFGEGMITLNGLPFNQASDAEQLRASIAIAMAANPRLRIIRIRDGSLLDDNSMRIVAEMAEHHDCQVLIETVNSDRPGAIVISDGEIVASDDVASQVAAE